MLRQLTVNWDDIRPNLETAAQLTGLEYMQSIMDGSLVPPPIAKLLDFYLAEVTDGHAIFKGIPGEQHFNPMGTIHGGFSAILIDSATGCAVHTILPAGKLYSTAQLNLNMTRPIMPDVGELICEGNVIHRGSRMATAEATVKDTKGKLYAHGTATCFIFDTK